MCHPLLGAPPLFLKSIDIAGFKSFARPVRLELPPGITALVGPNGSGKSNVVDALRWAIGEQNVRDLRGQRSEDVIHAGPRRSLGLAEVTLTFDTSSANEGPAEMAVARRLYRSGESEYLVQGSKGRLRDLQDAVRTIGVAGADTVVVNQGMADALLTATPQERRLVLEQAAGLAGYRARREEARHKLQATSQNIQTMEVILAELEPRLRVLRRQARAVREREEAQQRLAAALERWYAARWTEFRGRLEELSEAGARADERRALLANELREQEEAAEGALAAEREWQRRREVAQASVHATQRELDGARFSLQASEQQRVSAERALAEGETRRAEIELALTSARQQYAEQAGALSDVRSERDELLAEVATCRHTAASLAERLPALESAVKSATAEAEAAERDRAALAATRQQLQEELTRDRARLEALASRLSEFEIEQRRLASEREEQDVLLAAARREACTATEQYNGAETTRESAGTILDRRQRAHRHLRARESDLARRRAAAQRTVEALEPDVGGGFLAGLSVPRGWEAAVSAAVGTWPRSAATSGDRAADVERFLAWRDRLARVVDGVPWGDQLVELAATGLTPLHGALFVDDAATARCLWQRIASEPAHLIGSPPVRVITRGGDVVAAPGAPDAPATDSNTRYLLARQELETLDGRIMRLVDWLSRVAAAVDRQRDRLRALEADSGARQRERRAADDRQAAAERAVRETERAHSALTAEMDRIERERADLIARLAADECESRVRAQDEAARAARLDAVQERLTLARAAWEEERARSDEAERDLRELTQRADLLAAREAADARGLAALAEHVARLEREAQALETARAAQRTQRERWAEASAEARSRVEELTAVLADQHAALARVQGEQPELRFDRGLLEAARRRLSEQVREHERILAQLAQCEDERDRLRLEVLRELRRAPDLLPTSTEEAPADDEIRRLRLRANQYPDADETVVEECGELEERYLRLRSHVEDLNDAARDLDSIIATADREMRSRFDAAFAALDEEFNRVFTVMLQGGHAALELGEDGGVGVRAQLPGKRARASASFSGGEKALVASSLLFAMLRLRPTPFVVLDEVDAALDESNVDRYVAALRDINERTQVIIVTHNRATMEAADVLYGVTMDDEGVSRLLSVRLDAYAAVG